jgi:hypothetical protein
MPTLQHHRRLIPTEIPPEELKRDARMIRAILRKYSLDPAQYSAVLPLHPASVAGINQTHCLTVADVVDAIYGRDYIYEVFEREATDKGLTF